MPHLSTALKSPFRSGVPTRALGLLALLVLALLSACGRVAPASPERSLETAASPLHVAVGQWGGFGSTPGTFKYPHGVAVDRQGYVYVTNRNNSRVQKFTADGTFVTSWGRYGSEPGQFAYPLGVATDADNDVYVVDASNNRVQKFTSEGAFITSWGEKGSGDGQFSGPNGIAVDGSGYVYVTETGGDGVQNDRVQKFTADGTFVTKWGRSGSANGQFDQPVGIAVSAAGHVYVGDAASHRIQRFSTEGVFEAAWGTNGSGPGQFRQPHGLAVDGDGRVFVADKNNLRVQVFTPDGAVLGQWGMNSSEHSVSNYPLAVAVGGDDRVYVTDMFNSFVWVFAPAPAGSAHVLVKASGRGTFAQNATLRAALSVDSDPLAGAAVSFFLNDAPVGSGVTDAAGVATLSGVPLTGLRAGVHEGAVRAQFTSGAISGGARGLLVVNKAKQTLAFTSPPLRSTVPGKTHLFIAEASSGLPVSLTSLTPEVCTLTEGRAAFIALGTCTVEAAQPGNADFHGAASVVQEVQVVSALPTLLTNVSGASLYGGAATLSAKLEADGAGVAGQTVSFTVDGRPVGSALTDAQGAASLRNVALAGTAAGLYEGVVTASFAGTDPYAGAQASGTLSVGKAAQTLTFAPLPASAQVGSQYPVSASSSAGLPVSITLESASVCQVGGGTVSFVGAGTCTLRATQAGDGNHEAAPEVVQQTTVTAPPSLTPTAYALTFDRLTPGRIVWSASLGSGIVSTEGTNRNKVAVYAKRRDRSGNMAMVTGTQRQLLISSDGRAQRSYARGGYLDVMFKAFNADLVSVESLKVYGATTAGGTVEVFGPGGLVTRLTIPKTSSSGSTTLRLDAADVLKLRVNLTGPGRVDDVVFESAE